jgi:hypothetical protein
MDAYRYAVGDAAFPSEAELLRQAERAGMRLLGPEAGRARLRYYDDAAGTLARRGLRLCRRSVGAEVTATLARADGSLGVSATVTGAAGEWPPAILRRVADLLEPGTLAPRLELTLESEGYRTSAAPSSNDSAFVGFSFVTVEARYPGSSQSAQFREVEVAGTDERLGAFLRDLLTLSENPAPRLARAEALLCLGLGFRDD